VSEVLGLFGEKHKNHDVQIRLDLPEKSEKIRCRPVQISQVLLNLIFNAFDAIKSHDEKWIEVQVQMKKNRSIWSVTDSGRGIEGKSIERIFEPFFTTKPVGQGTGLGLSISKGLIESHGGTLTLDTKSPHTRFVFELPNSN
jgi:C4-dicarboxylate-specific signal transduction histidine kinase